MKIKKILFKQFKKIFSRKNQNIDNSRKKQNKLKKRKNYKVLKGETVEKNHKVQKQIGTQITKSFLKVQQYKEYKKYKKILFKKFQMYVK